jgi:VanZ family protein
MQRDQRKWLWWLAVGLWIAVILGFSSDRFSAESTSRVLAPLIRWFLPDLPAETQRLLLFLLRKGAHAFEYAALAALTYRALRESSSSLRSMGFALALVSAVAVTDETHQAFAAKRTGSAIDVSIDVAGGAVALFLLAGVGRRIQAKRPKREVAG